MIPTKTSLLVEGDLMGEEIAMTLDENSVPFLMSVFIDLYKYPLGACVREYSTNALDSHIAAGQTRPIEVTTPNGFSSFLEIEDFGLGMDANDIRSTYSKFGASTKRNDNTQNGMLGLGSKAALTFTNAFNVTGIKNGIETHVAVMRTANGAGNMEIISELPTDKPNGVKISIPMRSGEVENVVRDFFRFWKPGTVLVNGKEPKHITGTQIGDFLYVPNLGYDYVVMGNVAYPIDSQYRILESSLYYHHDGVVAWVDMGEVNFTPSREALHMTGHTKATLAGLRRTLATSIAKHIEDEIENAPTHAEAAKKYFELKRTPLRDYVEGVKYKGEEIPEYIGFDHKWDTRRNTITISNYAQYQILIEDDVYILHGYTNEKVHSTHRAKLRTWLADNDIKAKQVYICEEIPGGQWTKHIGTVHWDEVKKVKLQRAQPVKIATDEVYDEIDSRGWRGFNMKVDSSKTTLLYGSNSEISSAEAKEKAAKFLVDDDTQFVLLHKNRWKKFKLDHPNAVHFMDALKQRIADYQANLTDAEKFLLKVNGQNKQLCARLDATKIDDPELSAYIAAVTSDGTDDLTLQKNYQRHMSTAYYFEIPFVRIDPDYKNVFERYPLMRGYGSYGRYEPEEHVYTYLNAAYQNIYKTKGENE